jgi:hypothetical protein
MPCVLDAKYRGHAPDASPVPQPRHATGRLCPCGVCFTQISRPFFVSRPNPCRSARQSVLTLRRRRTARLRAAQWPQARQSLRRECPALPKPCRRPVSSRSRPRRRATRPIRNRPATSPVAERVRPRPRSLPSTTPRERPSVLRHTTTSTITRPLRTKRRIVYCPEYPASCQRTCPAAPDQLCAVCGVVSCVVACSRPRTSNERLLNSSKQASPRVKHEYVAHCPQLPSSPCLHLFCARVLSANYVAARASCLVRATDHLVHVHVYVHVRVRVRVCRL